jgi:hypothetical protein
MQRNVAVKVVRHMNCPSFAQTRDERPEHNREGYPAHESVAVICGRETHSHHSTHVWSIPYTGLELANRGLYKIDHLKVSENSSAMDIHALSR